MKSTWSVTGRTCGSCVNLLKRNIIREMLIQNRVNNVAFRHEYHVNSIWLIAIEIHLPAAFKTGVCYYVYPIFTVEFIRCHILRQSLNFSSDYIWYLPRYIPIKFFMSIEELKKKKFKIIIHIFFDNTHQVKICRDLTLKK